MGFDWKATLGIVAPTLATALGGPLAGVAVSALGSALGLGNGATETDIAKVMGNLTPEQIAAIKQAEFRFQSDIAKYGVDLARISADDRRDARARSVAMGDVSTPRLIAIAAFISMFICLIGTFALAIIGITMATDVAYLLGSSTSASFMLCKSAADYYMGNNSESGIRDQMIYRSMPMKDTGKSASSVVGVAANILKK